MHTRTLLWLGLALVGCGAGDAGSVEPGVGIGPVALGARYDSLDPGLVSGARPLVFDRLAFVELPDEGLELALASTLDEAISPDARILGVATTSAAHVGPVRVGSSRAEVAAALGEPTESVGDVDFWEAGVSVTWDGDRAEKVAVFAPYVDDATPPPMAPARGVTP